MEELKASAVGAHKQAEHGSLHLPPVQLRMFGAHHKYVHNQARKTREKMFLALKVCRYLCTNGQPEPCRNRTRESLSSSDCKLLGMSSKTCE